MSAPFRFGVTAGGVGDLGSWRTLARDVEATGYDTLLLPETVHGVMPLPALGAAAAGTDTLRVGTWVLNVALRTEAQLTWEARSVWELLGERFELGVGAGRPGGEADAAALGLAYPDARVRHLSSAVATVRAQVPDLRLLVAAGGPRMLALAAGAADTVALALAPDADDYVLERQTAAVRAATGRDVELAIGVAAVGDSPAPWLSYAGHDREKLAARGAVGVLTGSPQAMAERLLGWRERFGVSYLTVPHVAMTAFAPVVDALAGQ